MLKQGGLLTEHGFGSQPEAFKFPARNRIIAGLADVVIVVEAAAKGGALITADIASSYDREVFAVPGHLTSPYSAGSNQLIKSSVAHLFTSVADLAQVMNWSTDNTPSPKEALLPENLELTEQEAQVVLLLKEHPKGLQIDELSWRAQIPVGPLSSVLLTLEFRSIVRSFPGKKFALV
ncbi:DNA-processing protein DprA [Nafulsella turpanensis]|uniref:DNA-processing protein DprA n=1 Tax=Nafulsella turpanensis TaxID=1265690 RepID=UPI00034B93A5|nr:DNA-processing protein DprA [Nafulsella turpanensis]